MTRIRQPLARRDATRRADCDSFAYTVRDDVGLRFVAQQKFVSVDHLGQFLAPDLEPALDDSPAEERLPGPRGGKRDDAPWPRERQKRLHAVAELVRRWEQKMGYAQTWKPWAHELTWVRVTAAGLRALGLDWNDTPFPEDRHRLTLGSHTYQVNARRLFLARGGAEAPSHRWLSEREIMVQQAAQGDDATWMHRPDGVLLLHEDGAFPIKRGGAVAGWIPLRRGQTVAIEVELTRKGRERLGEGILPSLLAQYDFAWYFCGTHEVSETLVAARRDALHTAGERDRIRILLVQNAGGYTHDDTTH